MLSPETAAQVQSKTGISVSSCVEKPPRAQESKKAKNVRFKVSKRADLGVSDEGNADDSFPDYKAPTTETWQCDGSSSIPLPESPPGESLVLVVPPSEWDDFAALAKHSDGGRERILRALVRMPMASCKR